jgi:hypothetical protein
MRILFPVDPLSKPFSATDRHGQKLDEIIYACPQQEQEQAIRPSPVGETELKALRVG